MAFGALKSTKYDNQQRKSRRLNSIIKKKCWFYFWFLWSFKQKAQIKICLVYKCYFVTNVIQRLLGKSFELNFNNMKIAIYFFDLYLKYSKWTFLFFWAKDQQIQICKTYAWIFCFAFNNRSISNIRHGESVNILISS